MFQVLCKRGNNALANLYDFKECYLNNSKFVFVLTDNTHLCLDFEDILNVFKDGVALL